ncbi:LysR family transcriptional regulator [Vibrio lentus]|nr:LysR family transcriptional regulator [Vibrio lentus]
MNSIFGNIDDLFLFCAVVEEGSLLSASKRLHRLSTMPTVNRIGRALNIRLLEKKGRELRPLKDGEAAFAALSSGMESIHQGFNSLLKSVISKARLSSQCLITSIVAFRGQQ